MGRYQMKRLGLIIFLTFIMGTLLAGSCSRQRDLYLEPLKRMESGGAQGKEAAERQIEELKAGIRRYRQEVDRKVRATEQLGIYYKMLAVRYMYGEMYQAAYDALEEARRIYPENPVLFHYAGVCAARLSQAEAESERRRQWLERAEMLYQRAIALDPRYDDPLYALSVLYVFELDKPEKAEELLDRLLGTDKKNADALFLLGNLYYRTGRLEQALEIYTRLSGLNLSEDKRREALANRKRIEEELNGSR